MLGNRCTAQRTTLWQTKPPTQDHPLVQKSLEIVVSVCACHKLVLDGALCSFGPLMYSIYLVHFSSAPALGSSSDAAHWWMKETFLSSQWCEKTKLSMSLFLDSEQWFLKSRPSPQSEDPTQTLHYWKIWFEVFVLFYSLKWHQNNKQQWQNNMRSILAHI